MKRHIHKLFFQMLAAGALLSAMCCCTKPGGTETDDPEVPDEPAAPALNVDTPDFAKGADVSWVSEMEASGKKFKKQDGTQADIFEVLKDVGINSIRLRVWVNPTGGWSGKADVLALAKRAAEAGMALMIDFHYSDFFADPSRQTFPKDWESDKADLEKSVAHIKEHTADVLNALKDEGVTPAWIQIGNETKNGFLWPLGQLWASSGGATPGGWDNFVQLYNAGYLAAKEIFPSALVMPHLNNAYDDNAWWFKDFKSHGGKMDAIALSHYPQSESKITPDQMNYNAVQRVKSLAATYKVPVIVSEVGVKRSGSSSAEVLASFMEEIMKVSGCKGVFYWEPEVYGGWKPAVYSSLGWNAYDSGAFTSDGRPSSIMNAFK